MRGRVKVWETRVRRETGGEGKRDCEAVGKTDDGVADDLAVFRVGFFVGGAETDPAGLRSAEDWASLFCAGLDGRGDHGQ